MGLIPKIVLTPLKWASKAVLHKTLLRFPGGDSKSPIACVYCPEMCRFSCPTAVVSGNDAVTPCNKMGLLYKEKKWPGQSAQGGPLWPIYDCTGCGRCTEYCVYEMPVMDQLFEARKLHKWEFATKAAAELTDEIDPVGDLADELGDEDSSIRRLEKFTKKNQNRNTGVREPRSLFFLRQKGFTGSLTWEPWLHEAISDSIKKKLSGKTWLLHESVWLSRHLNRVHDLQTWIEAARMAGLQLKRPFAQGHDCIDCGGEGAYPRLFPSQSLQMAREFWERDQHRADGILCMSKRCADHFRKALDSHVAILAFEELQN